MLYSLVIQADDKVILPEPLTYSAAIKQASNPQHYNVAHANEVVNEISAELSKINSSNDIRIDLSGRIREVGVSDRGNQDETDDSLVSLFVRKPLYDFGVTKNQVEIGLRKLELGQLQKDLIIESREVSIAQKYFDVIHADNEFLRNNEEMALGYIRYNRAQENVEFGLSSEFEVLKRQGEYERIRQNRFNSENNQRFTRILLAEELGFPETPSDKLAVPDFPQRKVIDDVDILVEQAFKNSLLLKINRKKVQIAAQKIKLASQLIGPKLDAELEVSDYSRESAYRDEWRASIYFNIPLYNGGSKKFSIYSAQAEHRKALSDLSRSRSEVRVLVLKYWQAIRQNNVRLGGEIINQDYRDMYLDKSRAEYELEFSTDLGDAMVQFSDSRMKVFQVYFEIEMAWLKLTKLLGKSFVLKMQHQLEKASKG